MDDVDWDALFLDARELAGLALATDRRRAPADAGALRRGFAAWDGAHAIARVVDARWLFATAARALAHVVATEAALAGARTETAAGSWFDTIVREPVTGTLVRSCVHVAQCGRIVARLYVRGDCRTLATAYAARLHARIAAATIGEPALVVQ
jgi:hypothetical protein